MTDVHPGGYSQAGAGRRWAGITVIALAVIALAVFAFIAFAIIAGATEADLPFRVPFLEDIDPRRTLPIEDKPVDPGRPIPGGGSP